MNLSRNKIRNLIDVEIKTGYNEQEKIKEADAKL
jgi:hypothetical protein